VGATATHLAGGADARARIGPNAIIRLVEALDSSVGRERSHALFERAGQARHLAQAPADMVEEGDVTSLYTLLPRQFGPRLAAEVSGQAGWLTGDYLLAHRIPRPVQMLLHVLPAALAARVLLAAIARHAWTFVGSGSFSVRPAPRAAPAQTRGDWHTDGLDCRPRLLLRVDHCPICRGSLQPAPGCSYYASTFECLFVALVQRRARVREVECAAQGAPACLFEVSW
jgi:divinyl protochlorophyllide a 8-vinyl-reductase